jgi:UDP-N-acetylglucosamine acyltransferase
MAITVADHASVDPRAEIDDEVEIGPFCVVGPKVRIGRGTRLLNNVTLLGDVSIGQFNTIYPQAVIGGDPQDLSFSGRDTRVVIGDHNTIRESVTVNRGSDKEDGVTVIGDHSFLMACSHVAHDCRVGNHVVVTNGSLLGGHVRIDDYATLSGGVGVHHFATIGRYAFVSGMSRVLHDVPPFMLCDGSPARPRCLNVIALRRNRFSREVIDALGEAHRLLYRDRAGIDIARAELIKRGLFNDEVQHLFEFVAQQQLGRHGRSQDRRRAA